MSFVGAVASLSLCIETNIDLILLLLGKKSCR